MSADPLEPRGRDRFPGLNPAFLDENGLVLLGMSEGRLAVGMMDVTDRAAIAALRFATGCEIDPVAMDDEEMRAALSGPQPPGATAPGGKASLADRASHWLHAPATQAPQLAMIALLIEAGCEPVQAGRALLGGDSLPADAATHALALQLASGTDLAKTLAAHGCGPAWLARALAACPDSGDRPRAFVRLFALAESHARQKIADAQLPVEIVLIAIPVAVAWLAISPAAGVLSVLAALGLIGWLRHHHHSGTPDDLTRSHVLAVAAELVGHGVPEPAAVSSALDSADLANAGNGEGLAHALALDPLQQAALTRGNFAPAATALARRFSERHRARIARATWLVRAGGLALFALALALLVS